MVCDSVFEARAEKLVKGKFKTHNGIRVDVRETEHRHGPIIYMWTPLHGDGMFYVDKSGAKELAEFFTRLAATL